MNNLLFSLITLFGSFFAGILGALSGLGGGIVITPLLVFILGVDIRYAIGTSLIAVIATSIGSSSAYVEKGYTNIHAALFLVTATTIGAICGALLATIVHKEALFIIFGVVLIFAVFQSYLLKNTKERVSSSKLARLLKLEGIYPETAKKNVFYGVKNVTLGWFFMLIAGLLSGMLGIGSGALKVVAMDSLMKFPFKVSTTTSNFMIGFTAAASIGIYLNEGYVEPALVMPVILGVVGGSFLGAKLLPRIQTSSLRLIFSILVFGTALAMLYRGFGG